MSAPDTRCSSGTALAYRLDHPKYGVELSIEQPDGDWAGRGWTVTPLFAGVAQPSTEAECADVVSDLFEARAEIAMYRKLIAEGVQCSFDDAMVTLFVNDDSDHSVGLHGKPYLGLSCNYEIIPLSLLKDIKSAMGDNWERCVASWQEAYAPSVSSTVFCTRHPNCGCGGPECVDGYTMPPAHRNTEAEGSK